MNPQAIPMQQAPQMPQGPQRPGLLQRIAGGLFPGGHSGGLLDPEQLQGLQRQGLLQLGLGLLANSGQRVVGTPGASFGERLAMSFPNWQQMVQGASHEAAQARVRQVVEANPAKENETQAETFTRLSRMAAGLAGMPGTEEAIGKITYLLQTIRPDRATENIDPLSPEGIKARLLYDRSRTPAPPSRSEARIERNQAARDLRERAEGDADLIAQTNVNPSASGIAAALRVKYPKLDMSILNGIGADAVRRARTGQRRSALDRLMGAATDNAAASGAPTPEPDSTSADEMASARSLVSALPPDQARAALAQAGYSEAAISQILGKP
jgi:hypothetical protein